MQFVYDLLTQFQVVKGDFPMSWAAVFAYVAGRGDVPMSEFRTELNMKQSTVSHAVLALSTGATPGADDGLDLLETYVDLADRRTKRVRLTAAGKRLANAIERVHGRV